MERYLTIIAGRRGQRPLHLILQCFFINYLTHLPLPCGKNYFIAISIQTYLYKIVSLFYIKCWAKADAVVAIARRAVFTKRSWNAGTIVAVTASTNDTVSRRISLICPFIYISCQVINIFSFKVFTCTCC